MKSELLKDNAGTIYTVVEAVILGVSVCMLHVKRRLSVKEFRFGLPTAPSIAAHTQKWYNYSLAALIQLTKTKYE
jgi:hypothetical protein